MHFYSHHLLINSKKFIMCSSRFRQKVFIYPPCPETWLVIRVFTALLPAVNTCQRDQMSAPLWLPWRSCSFGWETFSASWELRNTSAALASSCFVQEGICFLFRVTSLSLLLNKLLCFWSNRSDAVNLTLRSFWVCLNKSVI